MTTSPEQAVPAQALPRAGVRFMLGSPWRVLAFGFGAGLAPWAPGTVGTAWSWLAFVVLDHWLGEAAWGLVILVAFGLGAMACAHAARDLAREDPGAIVWDEVVAFWLVLWVLRGDLGVQFAAFLVFRFFDTVKPPPVGYVDRRVPGGLGVMLDDLVAAAMTLFAIALWRAW